MAPLHSERLQYEARTTDASDAGRWTETERFLTEVGCRPGAYGLKSKTPQIISGNSGGILENSIIWQKRIKEKLNSQRIQFKNVKCQTTLQHKSELLIFAMSGVYFGSSTTNINK